MINEDVRRVEEPVSEVYTEIISNTDIPAENKPKPHTEELSKEEKRLEKLSALKEKYEKALTAKAAAEKKTSSIGAQIAKIENELHAEEDNRLMAACKKKDITYAELAEFIDSLPDNMKLSDLL